MNKNYSRAKWDTINSTFKQTINFKNGKSIDGYSKRKGFDEVKNYQLLIQNWILRSFKDGYLDPSNKRVDDVIRIDFLFRDKTKGFIDIFSVYQTYIEWNELYYRQYLDHFFKQFFKLKKEGKNPYDILYSSTRKISKDPFDLSTKRFQSLEDLKQHCIRLILDEVKPLGSVEFYYIKYCEKYFFELPLDLEFFKHINFKCR